LGGVTVARIFSKLAKNCKPATKHLLLEIGTTILLPECIVYWQD
jgi:hypothetical protein